MWLHSLWEVAANLYYCQPLLSKSFAFFVHFLLKCYLVEMADSFHETYATVAW